MSRTVSPSSNKPYGVAQVTAVWDLARSSFYAARHREQHPREVQKRGPKFPGIEPSPAFVRQPEGNGCIERLFRTLKKQLPWIRRFRDLDEPRAALIEFQNRYNQHWILERLSCRTPAQTRRDFHIALQVAA